VASAVAASAAWRKRVPMRPANATRNDCRNERMRPAPGLTAGLASPATIARVAWTISEV
jgi:hypothetical protein